MEAGFVVGGLRHSPLVVSVRTGTLPLEMFILGYVCLVLLNHLIHLMQGQLAVSSYLRVQNVSDFLFDSI